MFTDRPSDAALGFTKMVVLLESPAGAAGCMRDGCSTQLEISVALRLTIRVENGCETTKVRVILTRENRSESWCAVFFCDEKHH